MYRIREEPIKMQDKILVTQSSMPPYEEYIEAIRPLWETHWLTNMGKYHQELEERLKKYLGVPGLSLMVNGHMALELALQVFDLPEDAEVITTPFTFISTTNAIIRNHLKPVFCDIKLEDGTIDEGRIEELITENTAAIMPVHVYGNVCNVEKIQDIASKHHLKVIYDAAHAFGIRYKGRGIGSYGDASVFSFHATKVFNTIEGGAVTFSSPVVYEKLADLKNFGIRDEELVTEIGANAKMNEFAAIMGLCNLGHIDSCIDERKKRYDIYESGLKKVRGIRLLNQNRDATQNYSYLPVVVEDDYPLSRDELYCKLKEHNIFARKYFYPLTAQQECIRGKCRMAKLENARELSAKVLALPLYPTLEMEAVKTILHFIEEA